MKLILKKDLLVFCAAFLFLFPIDLCAQECGVIYDQITKEPVNGVHIYLKTDQLVAVSNEEGKFCLQQSANIGLEDILSFSHVSYSRKDISLNDFQKAGSVLLLIEDRHQLGEVIIHTDRFMEDKVRYKKMSPMKYGLYLFGSVLVGDYIYVMGGNESRKNEVINVDGSGYSLNANALGGSLMPTSWEGYNNRLFRYDVRNDRWEMINKKFRKRAYHAIHHYNDKIYILGGKRLSPNRTLEYLDEAVEIYDLKKDSVIIDPVNPHQAVDFASFMYDGNIILMGGSTKKSRRGTKLYTNKVHAFDVKSGFWYELPKMPVAKETKGVVIGKHFYMLAGNRKRQTAISQIDRYNIAEGKIETIGELLYVMQYPAMASEGNVIYLFEDELIQTYNVATGERYAYQIDLEFKGSEMFCADGNLYILGGYDIYEKMPSRDLYCVEINEFNRTKLYTANK